MRRKILCTWMATCLITLAGGCSESGEYLTDGVDTSPEGGVGVPVKVGDAMSYSLLQLSATKHGKHPRVTEVSLSADDGVELVGVGWLDSKRSNGAITVTDFPPKSYYERDFPQDRDSYHPGLPAGPIPGGGKTWSLIAGLRTERLGPARIHSVTVSYDVDDEKYEQTFDLIVNLCGYEGEPASVQCEAAKP